MSDKTVTTLLPCPFCGTSMTQIMLASQNPSHESWVRCLACDAASKMCVAHAGQSAEEWAASFWNMRGGVEYAATTQQYSIAEMCAWLESSWSDPERIRLFRSKLFSMHKTLRTIVDELEHDITNGGIALATAKEELCPIKQ